MGRDWDHDANHVDSITSPIGLGWSEYHGDQDTVEGYQSRLSVVVGQPAQVNIHSDFRDVIPYNDDSQAQAIWRVHHGR
jgi:hypothetical protein